MDNMVTATTDAMRNAEEYKHNNLCVLLNLYKSEDLSQFALLTELQKEFSKHLFGDGYAKVSVIIESKVTGNTKNSFIYLVVPHKAEQGIKFEIYFDNNVLMHIDTKLFDELIDIINPVIDTVGWDYTKYIKNLNNKDISVLDCLQFLLKSSKDCLDAIPDYVKEKIVSNLAIDFSKTDKALKMIEDDQPLNLVTEFIKINNLLPKTAVDYAESLMPKDLTFGDRDVFGVDKASINTYFDYIRSYTTFEKDPYPIYNIPDKVVYEDFDLLEYANNFDTDMVLTETASFKPKALKYAINYIDENKLAQILSRIYRGLSSDRNAANNKDYIEQFNPNNLDKTGMKKVFRHAIDAIPQNKLKPFELKAQEMLYSSKDRNEATESAIAVALQTIISSPLLISAIIDAQLALLKNYSQSNEQ